jgi:methionine biosynthesis protein MetW
MKQYLTKDGRVDFSIIAEWINPGTSVLDLGCGGGRLLEFLIREKGVQGTGVDIDRDKIIECIGRGIPVVQQDLNLGLKNFDDGSFDYVILSQTLQVVHYPIKLINEILRVGKHAIVSFPNFAHYRMRFSLMLGGHMPKSKTLPYEWYDTPNIHNVTIKDFRELCRKENIKIIKEMHIRGKRTTPNGFLPNMFSNASVVLISR